MRFLWATRLLGRNIKVLKHLGEMSMKYSGQNLVTTPENGFQADWTKVKRDFFLLILTGKLESSVQTGMMVGRWTKAKQHGQLQEICDRL